MVETNPMSGQTMIVPNAPQILSRSRRAWGIVGDLALAIALIWSLPLAIGIVAALLRLALGTVR